MRFAEYETWLSGQVDSLVLESGSIQIGPYTTPTVAPNKPPWDMEWTVLFRDGMYFRVVEHWYRRSSALGGHGYRKTFSFHYGPTNPRKDDEGIPFPSDRFPAMIRIDLDVDWRGPHIHFNGEDHILQGRVKNLRISDVEPFEFIRAVMQHRASGETFDKIMQFTVTK